MMYSGIRNRAPLALSSLALFFALGGASFAADVADSAARLITGKQVKNSSLTTKDVKDGSLLRADFKAGQLPEGPRGATGPPGATGPRGEQGETGPSTGPAGGDLTGTYPNPSIEDGAVTAAKLAPPAAYMSAGLPEALPFCDDVGPSWQSLSPTVNNRVGFGRDPFGTVSLRGIAVRCEGAANPVFTLPAGFRPERQEIQSVVHSSGTPRRLNVNSIGEVTIDAVPADNEWISLDGVRFRCAPSGSDGCP